jgi:small subunit ribosomal protein S30
MYQNMTRTEIIRGLPSLYDDMSVAANTEAIKSSVLDAVRLHYSGQVDKKLGRARRSAIVPKAYREEAIRVEDLIEDISSICVKHLSSECPHLIDAQYDIQPDVRSWWWVGGLPLPSNHWRYKAIKYKRDFVDQAMQYRDAHTLNIRTKDPLPLPGAFNQRDTKQVVAEGENSQSVAHSPAPAEYPDWPYHPTKIGYPLKWNWLTNVPGYWNHADQHDFPFLSYYSRYNLKLRGVGNDNKFPDNEDGDACDGIGVMSNFAWLNGLAMYHGFTPYHELTYPLTCQSVVTDGKYWNFYVYQLNSHTFHTDFTDTGVKNTCWSSGEMKLFDEYKDGQLTNVNGQVLDTLIKFYKRSPQPMDSSIKLKPYLGVDLRSEQEILTTRHKLSRRYGQFISNCEKWYIERAMHAPWEFVYGMRNPKAPPCLQWKKLPRYPNELKRDWNKFAL